MSNRNRKQEQEILKHIICQLYQTSLHTSVSPLSYSYLFILMTESFLVAHNNELTESKRCLCSRLAALLVSSCLLVVIVAGWITRPAQPLISSHVLLSRAEETGPHDKYMEP